MGFNSGFKGLISRKEMTTMTYFIAMYVNGFVRCYIYRCCFLRGGSNAETCSKRSCIIHIIYIYIYIQGISGEIVNILGGGSMDYSE